MCLQFTLLPDAEHGTALLDLVKREEQLENTNGEVVFLAMSAVDRNLQARSPGDHARFPPY